MVAIGASGGQGLLMVTIGNDQLVVDGGYYDWWVSVVNGGYWGQ